MFVFNTIYTYVCPLIIYRRKRIFTHTLLSCIIIYNWLYIYLTAITTYRLSNYTITITNVILYICLYVIHHYCVAIKLFT